MVIACIISFVVGAMLMMFTLGIVLVYKDKKLRNKVHFYITRDKDNFLTLWLGKPFRAKNKWINSENSLSLADTYRFCSYNLNQKDYKNLKWEDEPIEVFLNLE